ncbi:MAG: CoB--CoM heterodisulfide reductase iron-sulfur subunit A family protein [Anaerolineales bacterium]
MPEKTETGHKRTSEVREEIRIGVYTCYCGGNISDVVDCERVARTLSALPNVVVSRTNMSMCSDAGQALIEDDIREKGVNRVVIGACAPSLHELTFRGTLERAGLNPYLYYHVGLREQSSWVHHDDPENATEKSIRLMASGIAKARLLDPLQPFQLEARQHALVIGGGVAGLRCALDIARNGIQVTLIEKTPFLGGHAAQLENVFPTGERARELLDQLIREAASHKNISILTQARLVSASGYVGDFQIQVEQDSRGVTEKNADVAMRACEQMVPDPYNYGLTERKLVYRAYPGCYPSMPAVDWENCPNGRLDLNLDGQRLTLKNEPRTIELNVGAIVVATGFDLYVPRQGEYGYGEIPEVVTLPQLIRHLALLEDGQPFVWNGHAVRDLALIHCVGSRQIEGVHEPQADGSVNNYCSRYCCTASLHTLDEIHDRYPDVNVYDLYQDIRTYGRGHEVYYRKTLENLVRFIRYRGDEIPVVKAAAEGDGHPVLVETVDTLTWGEALEIPVDLVVLAVGMMPRDVDDLVQMLKISRGTDRFLLEVHPKLRPVETAVPGVVLAGTAQSPMNIQESCAAAKAAAAKVVVLLGKGSVELEPFVARVDAARCTGSGHCVEICAYEDAITLEAFSDNGRERKVAVVTPANCAGCGACVSACPEGAIDVQGWTLKQYLSMVQALGADYRTPAEVEA